MLDDDFADTKCKIGDESENQNTGKRKAANPLYSPEIVSKQSKQRISGEGGLCSFAWLQFNAFDAFQLEARTGVVSVT